MAENTKIEWAHHTFNPWIGCTKVGPGCDHCYAEADFDKRRHVVTWGAGQPRKLTADSTWAMPLRWNKDADRLGVRYRVFCASLADVFDNEVPVWWRFSLLHLIAETPHLDWLLLTKRIGNARSMLDAYASSDGNTEQRWTAWPNVWIGATITSQEEADRDIPKLLRVPAAKRFLSMEPLLGPVDLTHLNKEMERHEINALKAWTWEEEVNAWRDTDPEWQEQFEDFHGHKPDAKTGPAHAVIDWVIVGGESGPHARPMHPDWARSLRDQCAAAGVPFLFKQWGEHIGGELQPNPHLPEDKGAWRLDSCGGRWHDPMESTKPSTEWAPIKFLRVGKKAAGRLLDGIEHNGFPA